MGQVTGDFSGMTGQEIREQNRGITQQTRELAALTGALWAAVEARELWRGWGYPTFVEAVWREAPRAYSSVRECMLNYNYFVTDNHLTFGEFHKLVMEHGMRGLSDLRKAIVPDQAPTPDVSQSAEPSLQLYTVEQPPPTEGRVMRMVAKLYQWVTRRYRWNPEQDELAQHAIRHMKTRYRHRTISDDEAAAQIFAEYCSEKALRPVKKEAA